MSEIKHYSAYQVHTNHPHADDSYVHVADHDAAIADKDKIIADLKRQLEDAEDMALEKAAHVAEKSKRNGRLFIASEIRALKSNQK